ncbi:hypothetical protein Cni_G08480 [Canna indica]|uniref:Uncharacterized protein n=1 Tax=Canna indica TaxID=4628 RepID=A0AAQ3K0P9_9LILI|nr:hypothetical protein Cni_G08480 [Canna indica]
MSKKKSTTMTLKDFHGGSIPSQLTLPSSPSSSSGSSRPPDRPGAWGAAVASSSSRPDHHLLRPRPGSAGAVSASTRGLDERPPAFLPSPPNIGRHFDEDERKPFDASATPRRAVAAQDTSLRSHPPVSTTRSDPKRPVLSPLVPSAADAVPAPITTFPSPSSNVGSAPNAWGLRKDVGSEPAPSLRIKPTVTTWSASKLAQASAVEKVSSGRWQSKPREAEAIGSHLNTQGSDSSSGESIRVVESIDPDRERERPRMISPMVMGYAEIKESTSLGCCTERASSRERARSPTYPEMKERNPQGFSIDETRPTYSDGRFGAPKLYQHGADDLPERPKLNLLPRTKPMDSPDIQRDFVDKQVYLAPTSLVQVQNVNETQCSKNPPNLELVGVDDRTQAIDRVKLQLKPRAKVIEQSDGNAEKERKNVFGGARPREMVLKERGRDVAANELGMITPPNRNHLSSLDGKIEPQPGERAERLSVRQKTGKDVEKKGCQLDTEKIDVERTSWRSDEPHEQTRAESDTWRKPVEQPKHDNPAPRLGKAASALELAEAFSRPVSDATPTSQKSIPGQAQLPFSRLTDTRSGPSQRQINGY